jgi:hypothetical protein
MAASQDYRIRCGQRRLVDASSPPSAAEGLAIGFWLQGPREFASPHSWRSFQLNLQTVMAGVCLDQHSCPGRPIHSPNRPVKTLMAPRSQIHPNGSSNDPRAGRAGADAKEARVGCERGQEAEE